MTTPEEKPAVTTPRLNFGNPAASAAPATAPKPVDQAVEVEPTVTAVVEAEAAEELPVHTPDAEVPIANLTEVAEMAETAEPAAARAEDVVEEVADPAPEITETETVTEGSVKSVADLEAERAAIDAQIEAQKTAEKKAVMDQIKNVMTSYSIPLEELVEHMGGLKIKRKGVKAKPKYRDPTTGAIWTGRGKAPAWIRDKNFDDFLIVDPISEDAAPGVDAEPDAAGEATAQAPSE